jgi:hypothetical protein
VLGDHRNGRLQDRRPGPGRDRLIPTVRKVSHGLHDTSYLIELQYLFDTD